MSAQQRAYQFFLAQGYTPTQAAALASNMQVESSGSPTVTGDDGRAVGLFQWHPDRQANLRAFAQRTGMDPMSERGQLAFKHWELQNTEGRAGDMLRKARTPEEATAAVVASLRPAGFTPDNPQGAMHWDKRLAGTYALSGLNYSGYGGMDSPREAAATGRPVAPPPAPPPAPPAPSPPVYGDDIGTSLRRLGNWLAPDMVDPATPLTPEQIAAQKKDDAILKDLGAAQKGFLALSALGQEQPKSQPMLQPQVVRGQFKPLPLMRGLLG